MYSYLSSVNEILKSNFEFEFSIDFQGQVDYLESDSTEQFLEYELVLLFLIDKGHIPVNEKTEGYVVVQMGIVYLNYRTCIRVGSDWNGDIWEDGSSENLVLNLMGG